MTWNELANIIMNDMPKGECNREVVVYDHNGEKYTTGFACVPYYPNAQKEYAIEIDTGYMED